MCEFTCMQVDYLRRKNKCLFVLFLNFVQKSNNKKCLPFLFHIFFLFAIKNKALNFKFNCYIDTYICFTFYVSG